MHGRGNKGAMKANRDVGEVRARGRQRQMLPVNLRQDYGQENVLSTLTQAPIKNPVLSAQCESLRGGTTCSWLQHLTQN